MQKDLSPVGQYRTTRAPLNGRFSPYVWGYRHFRNGLYLPRRRDLPAGSVGFCACFDFGSGGNPALGPLETGNDSQVINRDTLFWGISGFSDDPSNPYLGYLLQIYTQHLNAQRQWFNKHVADVEICGTGTKPFIFKQPRLILAGDTVQVEVKNLNRTAGHNTRIQVVLLGGEIGGIQ